MVWEGRRREASPYPDRKRSIVLTASLARGIGWRTDVEPGDLLLQDAPREGDLFAEALVQLDRKADDPEIAEIVALLSAPLHSNCYLSPTQLLRQASIEYALGLALTEPSYGCMMDSKILSDVPGALATG